MTINNETNRGFITYYHGSAIPTYISATQFSLASIAERDQKDLVNMISTTSRTVTLTSTGLNGILTSAALTGTVSNAASSTTVTGTGTSFSSTFIAGDVIQVGSVMAIVASVTNNTTLVVTSAIASAQTNVSYYRGGLAPNTFYHLYAISNGTTTNLALSTRMVSAGKTLVDLPTGYSYYRQIPFTLNTDSSGNLCPFKVGAGWPYHPLILYDTAINPSNTNYQIFTGVDPVATTAVSCSALVPYQVALIGLFMIWDNSSATDNFRHFDIPGDGAGVGGYQVGTATQNGLTPQLRINTTGGNIEHNASGGGSETIFVVGYIMTEVP